MKLSEAIRLGAMLNPQGFGKFERNGNTCALGAALATLTYDKEKITQSEMFQIHWPWIVVQEQEIVCPGCRKQTRGCVFFMIVHLNDDHYWTREQIADWVESIEPKDTIVQVQRPDGTWEPIGALTAIHPKFLEKGS